MSDDLAGPREWQVAPSEAGARVDHLVAARTGLSHAAARRFVEEGAVRVNGRPARKGLRLQPGDRVRAEAPIPDAAALRPTPQPELPLAVLLLDEVVVALAKPAGQPSHPLRAGERGTLANALAARHPECNLAGADPREGGLAHRLDRDTSGVIIAARSPAAWEALRAAFRGGRAHKEYLALVVGEIERPGEVDRALLHAAGDATRVVCVPDDTPGARPARTTYAPLARGAGVTLVRAVTSTGRMHQVRAHLSAAGHPIVGDPLYGGPPAEAAAPGHFLHAARLRVPHPRGGLLEVSAPLPPDRRALLLRLGIPAGAIDG